MGDPVPAAAQLDARSWRVRARTVSAAVLPPLFAFLAARVTLWIVNAAPLFELEPKRWARYDSGWYESIATTGYSFATCASRGTPELGEYCASVAWYPGLPYLMRAAGVLGLQPMHAGILISQAAFLAALVVLWVGFCRCRVDARSTGILVLAAFFFGGIYYFAVFPISLFVLFVLLQVLAFSNGRWLLGGLAALAAGVCYPMGFLLAPVSVVWVLLAERSRSVGRRAGLAAATGLLAGGGTLVVFALHQVTVGRWDASLVQQRSSFEHELTSPLTNLLDVVVHRSSWMQVTAPDSAVALAAQTLVVAILVVSAVTLVALDRRRTTTDIGVAVLVVALWLFPLTISVSSGLYRHEAVLLPVVLLLRRAPTWLVWPFAVVAVVLFVALARLFERSLII